jgi:nicotinamidase-related amidase
MRGRIPWQDATWPGAIPYLDIDLDHLGLIVVDVQWSCADPTQGRVKELLLPNIQRLLAWFRERDLPIIFTRVGSLLPDAEDQHAKRRISWMRRDQDAPPFRSPVGSADYEILSQIAPRPGELIVDKNASGAFNSSAIDFHLQQLGLQTLVVTGVATFACVDNTARDAADRGYNVILVEDACAGSPGRQAAHDATVRTLGRYFGSVKSTRQLVDELDVLSQPRSLAAATA